MSPLRCRLVPQDDWLHPNGVSNGHECAGVRVKVLDCALHDRGHVCDGQRERSRFFIISRLSVHVWSGLNVLDNNSSADSINCASRHWQHPCGRHHLPEHHPHVRSRNDCSRSRVRLIVVVQWAGVLRQHVGERDGLRGPISNGYSHVHWLTHPVICAYSVPHGNPHAVIIIIHNRHEHGIV